MQTPELRADAWPTASHNMIEGKRELVSDTACAFTFLGSGAQVLISEPICASQVESLCRHDGRHLCLLKRQVQLARMPSFA